MKPTRENERAAEWSRNCDWAEVPGGKWTPRRLFVSIESDSTLIEVDSTEVTSVRDTAFRLEGGDSGGLVLTVAEAEWLIERLRDALDEQKARGWR